MREKEKEKQEETGRMVAAAVKGDEGKIGTGKKINKSEMR